ncbi:MAG: hypothetical protein WC710_13575 [Gallionella sp.]|jgi:hypothetical protein
MFNNRRIRSLEIDVEYHQNNLNRLNEYYWKLYHRHENLLKHLGLTERREPAKVILEKKGEPEPGS